MPAHAIGSMIWFQVSLVEKINQGDFEIERRIWWDLGTATRTAISQVAGHHQAYSASFAHQWQAQFPTFYQTVQLKAGSARIGLLIKC
jgi:hypothetical protein